MGYKDKSLQLEMSTGKAYGILLKKIIYALAKDLNRIRCFHCGETIRQEEFSIEHTIPWLYSATPKELYFDVKNICFSHLKCNIASARCQFGVRSATGFKGVWFSAKRKSPNKFRALMCRRIGNISRNVHIGWFATAEEAAKAYDVYALENLGKRAVTNKSLGLVP